MGFTLGVLTIMQAKYLDLRQLSPEGIRRYAYSILGLVPF